MRDLAEEIESAETAFWRAFFDSVWDVTLVDTVKKQIIQVGSSGHWEIIKPVKKIDFKSVGDVQLDISATNWPIFMRGAEKSGRRIGEMQGWFCAGRISGMNKAFLMPVFRGRPDWARKDAELMWQLSWTVSSVENLRYE